MNDAVITSENLTIGYRPKRSEARPVLADIDLKLHRGEFVCLLGPNGAGKSTLLRTLAGTQAPLSGQVFITDTNIENLDKCSLAQRLSVVLTDRLVVGNLTGYELVSLGRFPYTGIMGRLTHHDHQAVAWALRVTHCEELASQYVSELSDGQRQRILIARALAQEPEFMLLDEPTAFLDLPTRVEITGLLRRLAREAGLAVLLSTHDLDLALRSADTLWLITPDGQIIAGAPEDLVLQGRFAAAFPSQELDFDMSIGGFRHRTEPRGRIWLKDDGLPTVWMRRALEREGYEVMTQHEPGSLNGNLYIDYNRDGDKPMWLLRSSKEELYNDDIGSVIAQLRYWEKTSK